MFFPNEEREALKNDVVLHMQNIKCPQNIIDEFYEQYIFMSRSKLESMKRWNIYQFTGWMERE